MTTLLRVEARAIVDRAIVDGAILDRPLLEGALLDRLGVDRARDSLVGDLSRAGG